MKLYSIKAIVVAVWWLKLDFSPNVVVRVEISTRNEYLGVRKFYEGRGAKEVGITEDFYLKGNGLVIYTKNIFKNKGGK